MQICRNCGVRYEPDQGRPSRIKLTCSEKCKNEWKYKKYKRKHKQCIVCWVELPKYHGTFCTKECRVLNQKILNVESTLAELLTTRSFLRKEINTKVGSITT